MNYSDTTTIPRFLRQKNLTERGISGSHQQTRHLQIHHGFPLGRLLGPNTRVWTEDEIIAWLDSRPVDPSDIAIARGRACQATRREKLAKLRKVGAQVAKGSVWKNTPDGKTIRRNKIAEQFAWQAISMLGHQLTEP
jgi:hypothetical protein